jgi:hypothetical protein
MYPTFKRIKWHETIINDILTLIIVMLKAVNVVGKKMHDDGA